MLEERPRPRLTYRFTHELVRRALYDRLSASAGPSSTCGSARRSRTPTGRRAGPWPTSPTILRHRPDRGPGAGSSTTCSRPGGDRRARLRRGGGAAAHGARAADRHPVERAEAFLELGSASHRAGNAGDALGRSGPPPRSRASSATRGCSPGRRSATRRRAGARGSPTGRGGAARGGGDRARRGAFGAARRAVGRTREGARLPRRARPWRGRPRRGDRDGDRARRPGRAGDGADALLLGARRGLVEDILEWLTEARDLAEELGDTEIRTEAMAWRAPAFVALADLESARREVAVLLESAEQTAQPFMLHVAEHYGSAIALGDGRLEEAEGASADRTSGAGCSRAATPPACTGCRCSASSASRAGLSSPR